MIDCNLIIFSAIGSIMGALAVTPAWLGAVAGAVTMAAAFSFALIVDSLLVTYKPTMEKNTITLISWSIFLTVQISAVAAGIAFGVIVSPLSIVLASVFPALLATHVIKMMCSLDNKVSAEPSIEQNDPI